MKKQKIATIVNFCSNESRFLKATLDQACLFSSQVIVPVCDHFFDGTAENQTLLDQIYASFPDCLFIQFPFIPHKLPKKMWKKVNPAHFWHSLARFIGYSYLEEKIESVLFLDADEVPDGKAFSLWLNASDFQQHTVLKLANYWYFRDSTNQALKFEDSVVLAQKWALDSEILLHQDERDAIYNLLPGPKRRSVTCPKGKPMFHHFSWVRTKEEMLKKVQAWGHSKDRDWVTLVHEEFSAPFKGIDFVHGYEYKQVAPPFGISLEEVQFAANEKANCIKLSDDDVLRLLKIKSFWNFFRFL